MEDSVVDHLRGLRSGALTCLLSGGHGRTRMSCQIRRTKAYPMTSRRVRWWLPYPLCKCERSLHMGWGGGVLLQALGPPTIRFSQSSEKLKMQLEFDWPFFGMQPPQVAPGASSIPMKVFLIPTRDIWEPVKDEDSQVSLPEVLPW